MKKTLLLFVYILTGTLSAMAVDANTVQIVYNGTTATVTVASNISQYVTVSSGTSSHVVITQAESFAGVDKTLDNEDGEIIYTLSGSSADGSFLMTASYKATVELNGLTLANPSGAALMLMDGKRVALSAKKETVNTLSDGTTADYNGCIHCKGHLKLKGKGTLNVAGNSKHAIYSKEYMEVKNITLNITAAAKDAIHCKEYFLMESGTVKITAATDDGIQVELATVDGIQVAPTPASDTEHTDENTGNFYQDGGTLNISGFGGKAVKTTGTITYNGGTRNFTAADTEENATSAINTVKATEALDADAPVYTLDGRRVNAATAKGLLLVKRGNRYVKRIKN